ncbi:GNAT family N-acetyltransferase [Roseicyclus sp. F158]|uniref:GNAT family N-acetyltransferase n=1 Tax=Tropicimonas omnivorans TaxID=3075590 RepID=A0ABU3DC85_9RHOB|nr:GNAT family N-acetyltransferase [Roseicyclus sp. F158]MDT0681323.1 GNAT family N-acetyltransferase [Roseicyclus sp. F158]
MIVEPGFAGSERAEVAAMFWDAFGRKLDRLLFPKANALPFIAGALDPRFALSAREAPGGALIGIAGLKDTGGGLLSATALDLARHYGRFGALWRGPLLDMTDRPAAPGELLIDGLFVRPSMRGRGAGTRLIDATMEEARARNLSRVGLDVAEWNVRARELYRREGFTDRGRKSAGLLGPVLGVPAFLRMTRDL